MRVRARLEDLPREFAVFPLGGALLLPHGRLPLNIFEPRYLALVDDAFSARRYFGMIQPEPNASDAEAEPSLFRIGCLGRLREFSETDDGRYLIALAGIARFAVESEISGQRGYRRVKAQFTAFASDLERRAPTQLDRKRLFDELGRFFTRCQVSANWEALNRIPDEMLVPTLGMACPFDAAEKQALLEAISPDDQLAVLIALLQMGGMTGEGASGRAS